MKVQSITTAVIASANGQTTKAYKLHFAYKIKKQSFQMEVKLAALVTQETSQKPSLRRMLSSHQPSTHRLQLATLRTTDLWVVLPRLTKQICLPSNFWRTRCLTLEGWYAFNCSDTLQALQALYDTAYVCVCVCICVWDFGPATLCSAPSQILSANDYQLYRTRGRRG